jgi:hypothetical protein
MRETFPTFANDKTSSKYAHLQKIVAEVPIDDEYGVELSDVSEEEEEADFTFHGDETLGT